MIEVKDLTRSFAGRTAIRDVSFSVGTGEILGFLGPNGAGKTTTMRILTCYLPPDSGSARVDGLDVVESSLEVRKRIGYLPENPPLYNEMLVSDYLRFVARIRLIPAARRNAAIDGVVERCGLGDARQRLIGNLSKGFRQRVGLAQALIHDPPILILDEPTVGLDPEQIVEIRELIRALGGEHTVILSTHILPEVTVTCSRVAIISYGEIVQEGSLESLAGGGSGDEQVRIRTARRAEGLREAFRGEPWFRTLREDGDGSCVIEMLRGPEAREALARIVVERGWGLLEMTPFTRSLEEVYLEATRRLPGDAGPARGEKEPAAEAHREPAGAAVGEGKR